MKGILTIWTLRNSYILIFLTEVLKKSMTEACKKNGQKVD